MQARQKQLLKFIHLIFLTHQWTPVLKDLHKKYHLFDKKKAIWVIWYCKPIQIVHFHHWMYHIRKKKTDFKKSKFGRQLRSFQAAWFARDPWLHYDANKDAAFCFTCAKAYEIGAISASKLEPTFI